MVKTMTEATSTVITSLQKKEFRRFPEAQVNLRAQNNIQIKHDRRRYDPNFYNCITKGTTL